MARRDALLEDLKKVYAPAWVTTPKAYAKAQKALRPDFLRRRNRPASSRRPLQKQGNYSTGGILTLRRTIDVRSSSDGLGRSSTTLPISSDLHAEA
jgi:hypothetical protein